MARKKQKIEKGTIQLVLGLGALWLFLKIADTNPGAITLVATILVVAGGTLVGFRLWRWRRRRRWVYGVEMAQIDEMSGHQFERAMGEIFRKQGFEVEVTKGSGDQGADLILQSKGRRIVVQTKRWASNVSNDAVQEVVAAKKFYRATEAMVVATSDYTKSAKALAKANGVQLVARPQLAGWLREISKQPEPQAERKEPTLGNADVDTSPVSD
jgi:restriction system protein